MSIKNFDAFRILLISFLLLVVIGCAPAYEESNSKISGNLTNVTIIGGGAADFNSVSLEFDDGSIHALRLYVSRHYKFKLHRINEIHYDNLGHITKIEILE